jgi:S-adenosylmethionine/arginine decarboxylase-like enzyme
VASCQKDNDAALSLLQEQLMSSLFTKNQKKRSTFAEGKSKSDSRR